MRLLTMLGLTVLVSILTLLTITLMSASTRALPLTFTGEWPENLVRQRPNISWPNLALRPPEMERAVWSLAWPRMSSEGELWEWRERPEVALTLLLLVTTALR